MLCFLTGPKDTWPELSGLFFHYTHVRFTNYIDGMKIALLYRGKVWCRGVYRSCMRKLDEIYGCEAMEICLDGLYRNVSSACSWWFWFLDARNSLSGCSVWIWYGDGLHFTVESSACWDWLSGNNWILISYSWLLWNFILTMMVRIWTSICVCNLLYMQKYFSSTVSLFLVVYDSCRVQVEKEVD